MSLSAGDVAEIMRLLDESRFDELTLETGDLKLTLRRAGAGPSAVASAPATAPASAPAPQTPPPPEAAAAESATPAPQADTGEGVAVPSPLLGVFYRAPKPGEPPFVEVGDRVEEDTIVGIIEVMKLMNTVRAGVRGEVVAIPAVNGELVEYGETLLRVRPD